LLAMVSVTLKSSAKPNRIICNSSIDSSHSASRVGTGLSSSSTRP
jgi:hypothetical protein